MKFGKTIQARQIPGWGSYYLDYKFLKKIINSLASHRPASEASLLAVGIRPNGPGRGESSPGTTPQGSTPLVDQAASEYLPTGLRTPVGLETELGLDGGVQSLDLEPLPPGADPPAPGESASGGVNGVVRGRDKARDESFKAHRAVFFFKLGRELEKINAFYLTKERDLRLRILTLLNNRKRLLRNFGADDSGAATDMGDMASGMSGPDLTRGAEWANLEEGWRLLERDLGKLQQFVEINATGFRKILKKWDKRSKSSTKELYLERQVEIQPCFNRECITKMADIVAANLLDLECGSSHINVSFLDDFSDSLGADGLHYEREPTFEHRPDLLPGVGMDAVADLEVELDRTISGDQSSTSVISWLNMARELHSQHPTDSRLMCLLWRAAKELQPRHLEKILTIVPIDFNFSDKINGRNPLHEACISGRVELVKLCLDKGVSSRASDSYGRTPLHYAAIHGHHEICEILLKHGVDATAVDMDGQTPLIQAVVAGHVRCVEVLVRYAGAGILETSAISNDLIPLSLACQHGRLNVAQLLLKNGAKVLPNSEGLYPQHLAARAGHAQVCELLVQEGGADGGGKDRKDKYNLWTPLHHACVGGTPQHAECVRVLLNAQCEVNAQDEYGKTPGFYAAWYGQIVCLNHLLKAGATLQSPSGGGATKLQSLGLGNAYAQGTGSPNSDGEDDMMLDAEADMIPSLSLPPPIIPLRMYGHEFLANRSLVQVTLGHPVSHASSDKRVFPVKLYSRDDDENLHDMWSSLKLVMTSQLDPTGMPHSVVLPLADERETFGFHVEDLEHFALEMSLYPTFGSRVIGRAVVLPSTFKNIAKSESLVVPLLDHHLKAIGEVSFHVQCIRPFDEAQLEIGGRVETYWKSTTVAPTTASAQDHAHQFQPHRPLSVSTTSPSMKSVINTAASKKTPTNDQEKSGFVNASSLAGEYLHLVVQLTKDYVPVVYGEWRLPYPGLSLGVSDVTLKQFNELASSLSKTSQDILEPLQADSTPSIWSKALSNGLIPLKDVLSALPANIGANLEIRYASETDVAREGLIGILDLNHVVDAVLRIVYEAARNTKSSDTQKRSRRIIFSGFDATLCIHIQLKQPNFAVFYSSYCNVSRTSGSQLEQAETTEESLSVREAVKLAKSQNMLGVVLDGRLLATVPALVQSVKDAGLLLIALGSEDVLAKLRKDLGSHISADGYMTEGMLTLTA